MKKLLCTMLLLLTVSLSAEDAPPQEFSMPLKTVKEQAPRIVRLQLEMSESDTKDYGIQRSTIYNEMMTRLSLGQIQIKDDPKVPQLVLRIKTIKADRAIAVFIQLSYYEDALLNRNNSTIQAQTWSQATMLSCAPEDLIKEIDQVVIQMTNGFILDYQKALST